MVPLAPRKQVLSMRRHRSNQPNNTPPQPQPRMNHASSSRSVTAGKAVHVPIQPLTRKHQNKNKSKNTAAKDNNNSVMSSAGWRRYGIERRRQLIDQDIREGGNMFDLNYQCRIQGYFALSEKVRDASWLYCVIVNHLFKFAALCECIFFDLVHSCMHTLSDKCLLPMPPSTHVVINTPLARPHTNARTHTNK